MTGGSGSTIRTVVPDPGAESADDAAAVRLDDVLHDGEPEARAGPARDASPR